VTPERIATLPDELLSCADGIECGWTINPTSSLLRDAAQRICDLEQQLLAETRFNNRCCNACGARPRLVCGICGGHFCRNCVDDQERKGLCPTCPDRESA